MNQEFPDVQAGFRKGRGNRDQIANICWIIEKANVYSSIIHNGKNMEKTFKKNRNQQTKLEDLIGFIRLLCQCRRHKREGFDTSIEKIPWRRAWQPTSIFLPGESNGQRSLVSHNSWGQSQTQLSD